ncbi:MAG: RluA family pseudouridine synthase [Nitrospiria bacterium]
MATFPASPILVPNETKPGRLDRYLIKKGLPLTRSQIQRLISEKQILLNDMPTRPSYQVKKGDRIDIRIPPPTPLEITPEAIPLDILFEDQNFVVINKPAGMVVHPAPGHYEGTLVHALLHHCKDLVGIGGRERPGIIHRLDKDTSGILVVAKTDTAHRRLSKQFKDHTIERVYLAIVCGKMKKGGKLSLPIGRDRIHRKKISSNTASPREAETHFNILERFHNATLLEIRPQTGRTHQIRVHMAHLGHPLIGEKVYGAKKAKGFEIPASRHMLHAASLGFAHPVDRKPLLFSSPLPPDMADILAKLRLK